jgi:hypothetical protein
MTTRKKAAPAAESTRFVISTDAVATAQAWDTAKNSVLTTGTDLLKLFASHQIEEKHFGAPKDASDNEHVAARGFLWTLAAHTVSIGENTLDAEGIAAVFDPLVPDARVICGAQKAGRADKGRTWKNRISNKVGTQWLNLFLANKKAKELEAAKAKAEADLAAGVKAAEPTEDEAAAEAAEKTKKFWQDVLQRAYNKTFADDGIHISGDMLKLQAAIVSAAAETGAKLKPKK